MFWAFFWAQIALAVGGMYLLWRGLRGREVDDHPHCKRCGYDLYGLAGAGRVCPECGADLRSRRAVRVGLSRRNWRLVALAGVCGLAAYALGPVRQAAWRQWVQKPAIFLRAVAASDSRTVEHLLNADPRLVRLRPPGQSLLDLAVSGPRPERTVLHLLSAGADPNEIGSGKDYRPLHRAAWEGKPGAVQVLLTGGADPNVRDANGETPLHFAARGPGGTATSRMLLAEGADPNARDATGRTPLHAASDRRREEVVRVLVDGGADVNAADGLGQTPLHVAASCRDWDVTMALVGAGAKLAVKTKEGRTAAQLARGAGGDSPGGVAFVARMYHKALQARARDGKFDDVQDAIRADPAALKESGPDGPLLHLVVALRQTQLAKALLECGADANLRDADGKAPLHRAAWGHDPPTLSLLLRSGADPNARDKEGRTPLHVAADSTATARTVHVLVDGGADVRARDKDGVAPLEYAATSLQADRDAVARAMLDRGAPADVYSAVLLADEPAVREALDRDPALAGGGPGAHRATPLHVAALHGHEAVARLLVDRGADVNAGADGADPPGRTPLFDALGRRHHGLARLLLDRGARCDVRNHLGVPPLHVAVLSGGGEPAVRLVLEYKADPNATDPAAQTSLHLAAGYCGKGMVQALIEAGADVSAKDKAGLTPLDHAKRLNARRPEVAEVLEEAVRAQARMTKPE